MKQKTATKISSRIKYLFTDLNSPQGLIKAIRYQDACMVRKILSSGISPNSNHKGRNPLFEALYSYSEARTYSRPLKACNTIITLLLKQGADPNTVIPHNRNYFFSFYRDTAFRAAVIFRLPVKTLKLMLQEGADPNYICREAPAHPAKHAWNTIMLDHCFELARSPFMEAIQRGYSEIATLLLAHGADVNSVGNDGCTPLHCFAKAYYGADYKLGAALIAQGADVDAVIDRGRGSTLLSQLCEKDKHASTIRFLLEHGADPNRKNNNGAAPIHIAAEAGCADNIKTLLNNGAEINARDARDNTALIHAVTNINIPAVQALMARQPDLQCSNLSGGNAVALANGLDSDYYGKTKTALQTALGLTKKTRTATRENE